MLGRGVVDAEGSDIYMDEPDHTHGLYVHLEVLDPFHEDGCSDRIFGSALKRSKPERHTPALTIGTSSMSSAPYLRISFTYCQIPIRISHDSNLEVGDDILDGPPHVDFIKPLQPVGPTNRMVAPNSPLCT